MSNGFSTQQEKRVTIQTYQPTARSLRTLLKEHDDATDTDLSEWTVEIERKVNEPVINSMNLQQSRYRWEVTLTRSVR